VALSLNRSALLNGTGIALAIAVPAALVSQALDSGDNPSGAALAIAFVIVLAAFLFGGLVAGDRAPDAPLTHGALAALLAFALVQGVGTARRAIAGDDINVLAIPFNAMLAGSIGVFGGYLASWRASR
jgi:putative membrane protein (TIGR04086 family)